MGYVKYCVPFDVSKLILYGFSTDSLRICGRFAHNLAVPQKAPSLSVSMACQGRILNRG